MKIGVIIPTLGRKELTKRVIQLYEQQTRPPDILVVSAPDESHIQPYEAKNFEIAYLFGPKGSCAQRNTAIDYLMDKSDIMVFFDDDFIPSPTYLERIESAYKSHPDWAVITGYVVKDGIHGTGYSFEDGVAIIEEAATLDDPGRPESETVQEVLGGYGCNMAARTDVVGDIRFDERLPLYGWQEDIDFTRQLGKHGKVVGVSTIYGVHLGVKSGRVSGVRFGYSQVANQVYLVRKGTVPAGFAYGRAVRNVFANIVKSFWSEPHIDRRGRLRGNFLAIYHVLRGRVEPEYILQL